MTTPIRSFHASDNARVVVTESVGNVNHTINNYGQVIQIIQQGHETASIPPLQNHQITPIQSSEPPAERPLLPLLQTLYQQLQYSCIQRLVTDEGFSIEEQFVPPQLAPKKEQMLSEQNTLQGLDPDIIRPPPIELSELFSPTTQKIVIEAKSGGGKSTLLHYIAYMFSKYFETREEKLGSWALNFDCVIWISLKELNNSSIGNLLISNNKAFFAGVTGEEIDGFLRNHKGKILYLFDGYNEVLNKDFVDELLLKTENVIVTSHANVISNNIIGLDTKRFELIGFNELASEEFVRKFLTSHNQEDRIQPILSQIKSSESLQSLAKNPLTLELMCCYWQPQSGSKLTTISSLAKQMIPGIFNRYYKRKKEDKDFLSYLDLLDDPATKKMLLFYSQVAWKRLFQGSKIFDKAFYLPIIINIHPEHKSDFIKQVTSEIGIFKTTGSLLEGPECHFVHPFFLELFAALYLAMCLKENISPEGFNSIEEFFQQKIHASNTTLFMLTAGILQEENNKEVLNRFFSFLLPDIDQASPTQVAIASRCLEELPIQNPANRSQILSKLNYFLTDESLENSKNERELKEILAGCHLIYYELKNRALFTNQNKAISLFLMANLHQFFLQQEQAARENNPYAQFCLGRYYLYHSDPKKAFSYLFHAAKGGLAQAQKTLGIMYCEGEGVEKNPQEAFRLYNLATDGGLAEAQHDLALMHHHGIGVEKNMQKAVHLYQLAADQGLAEAQGNLAEIYQSGAEGVEKDLDKAFKYINLAAKQNNVDAIFGLGFCYECGEGTSPDLTMAEKYYSDAIKKGLISMWENGRLFYDDPRKIAVLERLRDAAISIQQ